MLDVLAPRGAADNDARQRPTMALEAIDGGSMALRWQPKMPGTRLLMLLLPILAAVALLTGWITRRVSRHALHHALLSDRRFAMLTQSQQELANSEARFR
ncbi:hypothetical protein AA0N74_23635, partial [Chromobacterium vaccinii]